MPDFFRDDCKEAPRTEPVFGLCDDSITSRACSKITDEDTWIAKVKNNSGLPVTVTAIDKCVFQDNEFRDRGRCDVMLTTSKHLYLVELKDRDYGGVNKTALEQLESTIRFLIKDHKRELRAYQHKKAFVCNKKRPQFAYIDNELAKRFFDKYRFKVDVQATVLIL